MQWRWRWRRAMPVALVLAVGALLAACTVPVWPQFGRTSDGRSATTATSITSTNVGSLFLDFQATLGANASGPVSANGRVFVVAQGQLKVFDAAGVAGCDNSSPRQCQPLWTASVPGSTPSVPAIGGGFVLVANDVAGGGGRLAAFDTAGASGCTAGPPVTCEPIWTAAVADTPRSVTIANGFVFGSVVPSGDFFTRVAAFDLAGVDGCSGVPTVCSPVWIGADWISAPAVAANTEVLVAVPQRAPSGYLHAYDPHGIQGCTTASPRVCTGLWRAVTTGLGGGPPAIVGDVVFERDPQSTKVFATTGTSCSGTPPTCSPLWAAPTGDLDGRSVAVRGGRVVTGDDLSFGPTSFIALDSAGIEGCSGSPVVCSALWKGNADVTGEPTIANDLVFVGGGAYLLHPNLGSCTAQTPPRCSSIASLPGLGQHTIALGHRVYSVRAAGSPAVGTLSSYRLP